MNVRDKSTISAISIVIVYTLPFVMLLAPVQITGWYMFGLLIALSYIQLYAFYAAQKRASGVDFIDAVIVWNNLHVIYLDLGITNYHEIQSSELDTKVEDLELYQQFIAETQSLVEDFRIDVKKQEETRGKQKRVRPDSEET